MNICMFLTSFFEKSLELQEVKRCFALPEAVLVPELLPSVEFLEYPCIGGTAVGSVHVL